MSSRRPREDDTDHVPSKRRSHEQPKTEIINELCRQVWDALFSHALQNVASINPNLVVGADTVNSIGSLVHHAFNPSTPYQNSPPSVQCTLNFHTQVIELTLRNNRFGYDLQDIMAPQFTLHLQFIPGSTSQTPIAIRLILIYADRHIRQHAQIRSYMHAIAENETDPDQQALLRGTLLSRTYPILTVPESMEGASMEIKTITGRAMNLVQYVQQRYIDFFTLNKT